MKKIIAMLLAVMMVLAMVACAAKTTETTTETPAAETTDTTETTEAADPVEEMTCQKSKALGFFFKKHSAEVTVTQTNLAVVCNRTGNTECLQAFTEAFCGFNSVLYALFDCDCCTESICPACRVLKSRCASTLKSANFPEAYFFGGCFAPFIDKYLTSSGFTEMISKSP